MPAHCVFIPGYFGHTAEPAIQAGGLSSRPAQGTLFVGVNAANKAAALAAVQAVTGLDKQGLAYSWLVSNHSTG